MKREKKQIAITVASLILAVGLLGWFCFFYQIREIRKQSENIQREKLESLVWQEKRNKMLQLKSELSEIEAKKTEMEKMYVSQDNAVPLFQALELAATLSGTEIRIESVDLSKIKLQKPTTTATKAKESDDEELADKKDAKNQTSQNKSQGKEDDLAKLKKMLGLSVEVTGDYQSLVSFLQKMEGLPYFIQIVILDIAPTAKKGSNATATGTLSANQSDAGQLPENQDDNLKMALTVAIYPN